MFFKKKPFPKKTGYYKIPQVDLSVKPQNTPEELEYLFENTIVDDSAGYLGHPDSVLLNNSDILTFYPKGHGKGAVLSKISNNGGVSYDKEIQNPPISWEKSLETPTVYRLEFTTGEEKLILISSLKTKLNEVGEVSSHEIISKGVFSSLQTWAMLS